MRFTFKAINKTGEKYEGTRESTTKFTLYNELKAEGDTLIVASEISDGGPWYNNIPLPFFGIPEHQKIIFAKNLGYMIDAGLPLAKSLSVLEKQITNKSFKTIILSIEADIRKGKTLSQSSSLYPKVFSGLFVSMVRAGEESGKLSESLHIVGDQMDGMYKLKKKIKGAMIYPSVIISIMIIIGILMLVYVVPSITATFEDLNVELPLLTRFLIGASEFLKNNIILSLTILLGIIGAIYAVFLSKKGKHMFEYMILRIPVINNLVKETNSAHITRTLSSLLSSGVPFSQAISITADVIENGYFKAILKEAIGKVEKGETISSVFLKKTDLCPVFVGEMMNVGEETGRLPEMLIEVASFYENSVDQKTKDISTIIEPVLMVIIGIAVGFFALAMIKPIYSLMDSI
jgi:type IV pilus assembly protein PilC